MANTPQARKRIRRNENRALINGNRLSRIRTFVKKVETAIAGGDKTAAAEALLAAQPELARGVARGVLHKNTVARKMSRLLQASRFALIDERLPAEGACPARHKMRLAPRASAAFCSTTITVPSTTRSDAKSRNLARSVAIITKIVVYQYLD